MRRWGPKRLARHNLGGVSDAEARQLLRELAPGIEAAVRAFRAWGHNVGLDEDDLRQIARVAVLDAAQTHRAEASTFGHWARRTIRWRLTEALERSERPEEPLDAPEEVLNGENPEEVLERLQAVRWVRQAVDRLDVRQRTIVDCRLRGESVREIGITLGISKTRAHQELHAALGILRHQAVNDRLDEEDSPS